MTNNRNFFLKQLYCDFNTHGVDYCCFGQPYYGEDESGDVDILVSPKHISIVNDLILNRIKQRSDILFFKRQSHSTCHAKTFKLLIQLPETQCPILQLDIFDSLHWRGLVYFDYSLAKNHINYDSSIPVIKSDIAACVGAFKDMVYCNNIKESRILGGFHRELLLETFVSFGFSRKLLLGFCDSYFSSRKPGISFLKLWFYRPKLTRVYFYYRNLIVLFLKGYFKDRTIALYGPDGAGKSYLIDSLKRREILNEYFDEIRLRHTLPKLLPPLSKVKNLILKEEVATFVPRSVNSINKIHAWIHSLYYSFDYFLEKCIRSVSFFSPKRTLYIYDRYAYEMAYQDTFVNVPKMMLLGLRYFSIRPLVTFFVFADPKVIFSRKQELTVGQIECQIIRFRRVDSNYTLNTCYIDNTSIDIEETINLMLSKIGDSLS